MATLQRRSLGHPQGSSLRELQGLLQGLSKPHAGPPVAAELDFHSTCHGPGHIMGLLDVVLTTIIIITTTNDDQTNDAIPGSLLPSRTPGPPSTRTGRSDRYDPSLDAVIFLWPLVDWDRLTTAFSPVHRRSNHLALPVALASIKRKPPTDWGPVLSHLGPNV
ncbi:hypothetical protein BN1723_000162 [Verticillium longisporum]|uniref:Uncharacterized protein n=1 Tax=Verticillium longisporum TaxID=100787 RepID=A0A0G4KE94_VERLO|nr:hypothetical protein BN1723_000162 [Verticillium longisporum]